MRFPNLSCLLCFLLVALVSNLTLGLESDSRTESEVLGYGTRFGTKFSDEDLSRRGDVVGLGAPPGFLAGQEEVVLLEVFHRYQLFKSLVGEDINKGYEDDDCGETKCPELSHCSRGICFCDSGMVIGSLEIGTNSNSSKEIVSQEAVFQSKGNCVVKSENKTVIYEADSVPGFGAGDTCNETSDCLNDDINFQCREGKCQCREDMKFNPITSECNIYISVNCSSFSRSSTPSKRLVELIDNVLAGNESTDNMDVPESLLVFIEKEEFTDEEILEAFCRDVDKFASIFGTTIIVEKVEESSTSTVLLSLVLAFLLLILLCIILVGCIYFCCREKVERMICFEKSVYTQGFSNKAVIDPGKEEIIDEKDSLEKVISGYQPVPQQPPPSYPQGTSSLPRGASLPRNNGSLPRNTSSLKRGVSPIPKNPTAYPQLQEAPPGYPESPQKTGPAPPGFPQSPPEYPQTPTPPGYPQNPTKQASATPI